MAGPGTREVGAAAVPCENSERKRRSTERAKIEGGMSMMRSAVGHSTSGVLCEHPVLCCDESGCKRGL